GAGADRPRGQDSIGGRDRGDGPGAHPRGRTEPEAGDGRDRGGGAVAGGAEQDGGSSVPAGRYGGAAERRASPAAPVSRSAAADDAAHPRNAAPDDEDRAGLLRRARVSRDRDAGAVQVH